MSYEDLPHNLRNLKKILDKYLEFSVEIIMTPFNHTQKNHRMGTTELKKAEM
jgi:hypothetical protein